jgi:Na+-transporting NADH:ubiquinone oxidoreductase subunit C
MEPGGDIAELFQAIEPRMVNLETGDYTDSGDEGVHVVIPEELDLAGIGERPTNVPVYLVMHGNDVDQIILPVYGKGLWSTMLGYLSLEPDGNTIKGLRFYAHAETPGLGDQIDKEAWRALWVGKEVFDSGDEPQIRVMRGPVPAGAHNSQHLIDGMSGATLTGNGVTGLVQYWTGPHGFGPYLKNYREAG